jgi:hypothetical protein
VGIGVVLLLWGVVLTIASVPVAAALIIAARLSGGPARAKRVFVWLLVAGPLAAFYLFWAFMTYAIWCGMVRGVDPGLGDWYGVPIGHGFSLGFIDGLDHGYISPRGTTSGVALIADITEIGTDGDYVYGVADPSDGFLLNTRTGAIHRNVRAALPQTLRDAGVVPVGPLMSVERFYRERRWGWQDPLAVAVLGTPALLVAVWTLRRVWNGRPEPVT